MLQEAIDSYHGLLADGYADETAAALEAGLARAGLLFGDRPLCTVLRPRLLTPEQYGFLQARAAVVLGAFRRAHEAAMADAGVRAQFGLSDWEEALIHADPGFPEPCPTSRLDAFFVSERGGLRFTEYNAETPAAPAYNDALSELFLALPVMREYLRRWVLRPLPARHGVLHALLAAYRRWAGRREAPRIAILDWEDVPTRSEFLLFRDYFQARGLACEIVDPRRLEYREGRLLAGDFHVTLIYKRVLVSELIAAGGLDQPVVRAVLDGAACMVNPFRCKLLHKKSSLAVLSDERNAALFTAAEREAIRAHVPWTRIVEDRRTEYRRETIDLLHHVAYNRRQFVLKPNDEYGGRGIVLGWECDDGAWQRALAQALTGPYIVQERVAFPSEPFPGFEAGRLVLADRILDTSPFICGGEYVEGCLTRLSTAALLNVTAGGGSAVPTFVVEKR